MDKALGVIALPIFEYECAKCRKLFEVVSSGEDAKRPKCPRCSSRRVTKLFSGFSVLSGKGKGSTQTKTSGACRSCSSRSCSTCG
ncbi:MAG: zinc ribbon domain-containing protein [Candidatus Eisenbacteria bacterium]